jgi:hypothetical protein
MSKTVLAKVDGFTPLIDGLTVEHGVITSAIFGKVWRYCQMSDGVCKASQERIADELGISRITVNTHIEKLCSAGYLIDRTPGLLGAPHQYADTGKAGLSISFTAHHEQPVKEIDTTCKEDLHLPVKEIDSKIVVKKDSKTQAEKIQKITKSANKTVDAILENERKSTGKQWTNLPEIYHPFAKVFQDLTGIIYTKKQSFDWMDTFDEWLKGGFQPSDVDAAIRSIQNGGRVSISRPGSVTWKLRAGIAARHISVPVSDFESDPRCVL